jgi:4-amino-4-deoxy-L-arabinose transferase-like glycosyltransferase
MKKKKIKDTSFQRDKKREVSLLSQNVDDILQKRWVSLIFLGVLFLIAFLIRLSFLKYYQAPLFGDAVTYAKIAWGLKTGHGLHWWSVVWSPFYPFMIFIFSLVVGSLETSAFAVSIFLGSLMVVPFFFLAKRIFNYPSAYLGSFLVVFFPALVANSVVPLSEATYTFFLLCTILAGWLLISKPTYISAFAFGILGAICYLTRPESLVAFALMLLVFGIMEIKRKLIRKWQTFVLLLISLLGFLILAFPYIEFMHSQTGHWILSGKTAHNILKQKAYSKTLDYLQQRKAFSEVLDGLTPDGEIKGKVLLGEESMLSFVNTPNFFGDYFKRTLAGIKKINLFFLPFLLFSLFYIFSWKVDREGWEKRVFLLGAFSPILTMPIFFIPMGRLLEPYAPILILLSVNGILNMRKASANLLTRHKSSPHAAGFSTSGFSFGSLAILLAVAVLSIFSLAKANEMTEEYENTFQALKLESEEFKKLGLWADQILPKDAVVMVLSGDSFLFYCNRVVFTIPFAPYERIVEFARRNKVNYLLASLGKEASWRDDLSFLLEPVKDSSKIPEDSRLKLVDIYKAPSGLGAVVYKFLF